MAKSKNPREKKHSQKPHSWAAVRSLFTCKYLQVQNQQHIVQQQQLHQQKNQKQPKEDDDKTKKHIKNATKQQTRTLRETKNGSKKMKCKIMQESSDHHQIPIPSNRYNSYASSVLPSAPPSISGSFRNMPFRKLSGCYECRMVVDPILGMTRDPSFCSCPDCGQIFMKPHNLKLHQAVRHAVSELGPDDTSKSIVEIIFQSSWLKKEAPVCRIDRILKVQNTPTTISKFEEYRDTIKTKATGLQAKKQPRCLADGNELLRFNCTTLMCPLGLNGSSNLCNSIPSCGVCGIIRNGFKVSSKGILTTATSGKAHDSCRVGMDDHDHGTRAMLVCRVIAGRVKKNPDGNLEDYDSVGGVYSNLDELYVFNPKAILPCFVVIYGGF